jgi:hypothetical protein
MQGLWLAPVSMTLPMVRLVLALHAHTDRRCSNVPPLLEPQHPHLCEVDGSLRSYLEGRHDTVRVSLQLAM